jgi:heme/copper-type cytochrome/quinol oxidase subunit 3
MTAIAPPAPAAPPAPKGLSRGAWGMWMLILTEFMIFGSLIGSYFYVRAGADPWPPPGIEKPELVRISLFTVVLLGSSLPMWWAEAGIRAGNLRRLKVGLVIAFVMGAVFFTNQLVEYGQLNFRPDDNVYGSLFFAITGLHGAHLVIGLLMNGLAQVKAWTGRFDAEHHRTVEVVSLYWHFVDAVWVLVFSSLYLSPHLIR